MQIPIYQVDAFAARPFEGNPAAVCPMETWPDDTTLQNIAAENNLSETAFFVPQHKQFQLRWFTPKAEVDLCGHATLAAAHVLYAHLGYSQAHIEFATRSGILTVTQSNGTYSIDFPAVQLHVIQPPAKLIAGLGFQPVKVMRAYDYVVELPNETAVKTLKPDLSEWLNLDLRGVVVTAPGDKVDFVSRCFFPKLGVNEDPVTGSAHCELTPYWQTRLNKTTLLAKQLSTRGGLIHCESKEQRVILRGSAADYMQGTILV